ncbi:hypothetical protein ACJJTC_003556 [Scirpophaga incertulas]
MDVDAPNILKRCSSAPLINEAASTAVTSPTTNTTPRNTFFSMVSNNNMSRMRRYSGSSFSPLSAPLHFNQSPLTPRLTPRVNQLRAEECADVSNTREVAHEREVHSAIQMGQSCEDLMLVSGLPNSPNSPTRIQRFSNAVSPSPTRKYTTRRSLSPQTIRASSFSPVGRGPVAGVGKRRCDDADSPLSKRLCSGTGAATTPTHRCPSGCAQVPALRRRQLGAVRAAVLRYRRCDDANSALSERLCSGTGAATTPTRRCPSGCAQVPALRRRQLGAVRAAVLRYRRCDDANSALSERLCSGTGAATTPTRRCPSGCAQVPALRRRQLGAVRAAVLRYRRCDDANSALSERLCSGTGAATTPTRRCPSGCAQVPALRRRQLAAVRAAVLRYRRCDDANSPLSERLCSGTGAATTPTRRCPSGCAQVPALRRRQLAAVRAAVLRYRRCDDANSALSERLCSGTGAATTPTRRCPSGCAQCIYTSGLTCAACAAGAGRVTPPTPSTPDSELECTFRPVSPRAPPALANAAEPS